MSEAVCPFCGAPSRGHRADVTDKRRPPAMRVARSAVWAFGVPVLALTTSACGGMATGAGGEDAATEASPDAPDDAPEDAAGDGGHEQPEGAVDDAAEEPVPDAHNTCDVFTATDYGLPPCR